MVVEPFELKGKTIKDAYYQYNNSVLVLELTEGAAIQIVVPFTCDEFSGNHIPLDQIEIVNKP